MARAAANTADALLSECVDLAAIAAALLAFGDVGTGRTGCDGEKKNNLNDGQTIQRN